MNWRAGPEVVEGGRRQTLRRDAGTDAQRGLVNRFSADDLAAMITTDGAGTSDIDYVTSVAQRSATQGYGAFQNGASTGSLYANFDQSYDPINGFHSATAPQTYTVAQGDTLQNIAQQVWGDASLWYLIAEANGVTSNTSLVAGMMLTIPDKVTNIHNAATTYRVYDPNAAVGACACLNLLFGNCARPTSMRAPPRCGRRSRKPARYFRSLPFRPASV
jgi:LysM repeat protein